MSRTGNVAMLVAGNSTNVGIDSMFFRIDQRRYSCAVSRHQDHGVCAATIAFVAIADIFVPEEIYRPEIRAVVLLESTLHSLLGTS
jgi:hypothetical protein